MKSKLVIVLLSTTLLFTACTKSPAAPSKSEVKASNGITANESNNMSDSANIKEAGVDNSAKNSVNTDTVKSNTQMATPKLTTEQKAKVNDKISTVVNEIDKILNSLEEAKELDLEGM